MRYKDSETLLALPRCFRTVVRTQCRPRDAARERLLEQALGVKGIWPRQSSRTPFLQACSIPKVYWLDADEITAQGDGKLSFE